MQMGTSALNGLIYPRRARSRRISSWDRTGGNRDFVRVEPDEQATLADVQGSGCIKHIWMTINSEEPYYLRQTALRMYWDDESEPSVEVPLGDFFGVGHATASHYMSIPLNMVTGGQPERANQAAMNCYFPMPFASRARLTLNNDSSLPLSHVYFHVDFEQLPALDTDLRFHAHWRRSFPTPATMDLDASGVDVEVVNDRKNLGGAGNYVLLDVRGRGHYVGSVLSIDHLNPIPGFAWFGEGDDMIFIDEDTWPPSLHGTGTEDYFGAAWGFPAGKCDGLYHGVSLAGPTDGDLAYSGKWTMYRFHIEDPICFEQSIRVTIEHGHANCHANDYSSVAYWYQFEPHSEMPSLPPAEERLPFPDVKSLQAFSSTQ